MELLDEPLVSIGVPAYNGANFLRASLYSLINQTYRNLQIVVSDDSSSDDTLKICNSFRDLDSRVIVVSNRERLGAVANYNRVLELADGDFFFWNAQDDCRHPMYVARCVEQFKSNKSLVFCHSQYSDSAVTNDSVPLIRSLDPFVKQSDFRIRFLEAYKCFVGSTAFYGMYRMSIMHSKLYWRNFIASDCAIFNSCLLEGDICEVGDVLFYYSGRSHVRSVNDHYRFLDPFSERKLIDSPYLRYLLENIRIVMFSSTTLRNKVMIIRDILAYELVNIPIKAVYKLVLRVCGQHHARRFAEYFGRVDLPPLPSGYKDS
jgi:glycosyltransferase involved in cell wall biosynthesis